MYLFYLCLSIASQYTGVYVYVFNMIYRLLSRVTVFNHHLKSIDDLHSMFSRTSWFQYLRGLPLVRLSYGVLWNIRFGHGSYPNAITWLNYSNPIFFFNMAYCNFFQLHTSSTETLRRNILYLSLTLKQSIPTGYILLLTKPLNLPASDQYLAQTPPSTAECGF